jgi:hypothetical protein
VWDYSQVELDRSTTTSPWLFSVILPDMTTAVAGEVSAGSEAEDTTLRWL